MPGVEGAKAGDTISRCSNVPDGVATCLYSRMIPSDPGMIGTLQLGREGR